MGLSLQLPCFVRPCSYGQLQRGLAGHSTDFPSPDRTRRAQNHAMSPLVESVRPAALAPTPRLFESLLIDQGEQHG